MPTSEMFETQVFFVLVLEGSGGNQKRDTKEPYEDLVSCERGGDGVWMCCWLEDGDTWITGLTTNRTRGSD